MSHNYMIWQLGAKGKSFAGAIRPGTDWRVMAARERFASQRPLVIAAALAVQLFAFYFILFLEICGDLQLPQALYTPATSL